MSLLSNTKPPSFAIRNLVNAPFINKSNHASPLTKSSHKLTGAGIMLIQPVSGSPASEASVILFRNQSRSCWEEAGGFLKSPQAPIVSAVAELFEESATTVSLDSLRFLTSFVEIPGRTQFTRYRTFFALMDASPSNSEYKLAREKLAQGQFSGEYFETDNMTRIPVKNLLALRSQLAHLKDVDNAVNVLVRDADQKQCLLSPRTVKSLLAGGFGILESSLEQPWLSSQKDSTLLTSDCLGLEPIQEYGSYSWTKPTKADYFSYF